MRSLLVAVAALVLLPAGLLAEQIRGQVKSVDVNKNMVTLQVGNQERTVQCTPKCRVSRMVTTRGIFPRRTSVQEYLISLNQLQQGTEVTVTTETQNGAEMATQIQTSQMQTARMGGGLLRRFR